MQQAAAEILGSAAPNGFSALVKAVSQGVRGRRQEGNTGQRGTKISVFISPSGRGLLLFSFFPLPAPNPLGSSSFQEH